MSEPLTTRDPDGAFGNMPGAGAQLRAAREAQGMHIAALAVALKVPVSRLEALEGDRFDLLPDPPFVRALAGSVCRALKIDPAPVLARLPQQLPQRLEARIHGSPSSFHPPGARKPGVGEQLSRPVVWSVLLLLVAAAALILLPTERLGRLVGTVKEAVHSPVAPAPAEAPSPPVAAVEPSAPPTAPAVLTPAPDTAPATANSVAVATPSTPASVSSAPVVMTPVATPPGAPAAGESQVVFQSTADSWVKVTDARGKVVFQKSVAPGAIETATGAAPLTVIVGKADVTQVLVHGQPFDMSTIARSNVARFEVK